MRAGEYGVGQAIRPIETVLLKRFRWLAHLPSAGMMDLGEHASADDACRGKQLEMSKRGKGTKSKREVKGIIADRKSCRSFLMAHRTFSSVAGAGLVARLVHAPGVGAHQAARRNPAG